LVKQRFVCDGSDVSCDELHKQCLFWPSKGIEQLTAAMVMLSCDKSSKDRESKAMKYAAAELK
jgi:hypothetical protein